jgi:hypothetical protein
MVQDDNLKCTLCGGVTAPGYLIAGRNNAEVGEFHGRHRNMHGVSVRRTKVEARMCTSCGYVMAFAENPSALDIEVGKG